LDPAYVSAFSALAGAAIGSLASFSTSWVTQRTQIRHTQSEAERARLEALYSEFITESARLLGDALSNQKDDIADMVGLYALVGRMRLVSSPAVVAAADQVLLDIIATYQGPNLALHEVHEYAREGPHELSAGDRRGGPGRLGAPPLTGLLAGQDFGRTCGVMVRWR